MRCGLSIIGKNEKSHHLFLKAQKKVSHLVFGIIMEKSPGEIYPENSCAMRQGA